MNRKDMFESRDRKTGALAIGAILLLAGASSAAPHKDKESAILNQHIDSLTVYPGLEFVNLCEKLRVPGGMFLLASDDLQHGSKPLRYKNTTAQKILDSLVARHPQYTWTFDNGVLLWLPKRPANELERVVSHYAAKDVPITLVPGFLAREAGLSANAVMDTEAFPPNVQKVSVGVDNLKLRDALNLVVKKDGHSVWVLSRDFEGKPYSAIMNTW